MWRVDAILNWWPLTPFKKLGQESLLEKKNNGKYVLPSYLQEYTKLCNEWGIYESFYLYYNGCLDFRSWDIFETAFIGFCKCTLHNEIINSWMVYLILLYVVYFPCSWSSIGKHSYQRLQPLHDGYLTSDLVPRRGWRNEAHTPHLAK